MRVLPIAILSACMVSLSASSRVAAEDDFSDEADIYFVRQPEAEPPTPPVSPSRSAPAARPPVSTLAAVPLTGLAGVPNMFGDFFSPTGQIILRGNSPTGEPFAASLPGGGLRRAKIADNNRALPSDRVYFTYNHFNNAIEQQTFFPPPGPGPPLPGPVQRYSLDRYLVGFEKTFWDQNLSVELRVPFASPTDIQMLPSTQIPGQEFGNINVALKALLYRNQNWAAAIGLGVDLPTGDDVDLLLPPFAYHIDNQAVFLQPFAALTATLGRNSFINAFVQVDLPANGNDVTFGPIGAPAMNAGRLNDVPFFEIDFAYGHWLYRNQSSGWINGIAGVVEIHYYTSLRDPDIVATPPIGPPPIIFANGFGRQDFLDLTGGLHARLGTNTTLNVGAVVPIRERPDRTFDFEAMVHLNHYFGGSSLANGPGALGPQGR